MDRHLMKQRICEASYAKGYLDARQEAKKQISTLLAVDGTLTAAADNSSSRVRSRLSRGKQLLVENGDLWRGPSDWIGTHKGSAALIAGVALGILLQQVITILIFGVGVMTGVGAAYWLLKRSARRNYRN